jgi:LytR cell envelope-related transcriptional attenuator
VDYLHESATSIYHRRLRRRAVVTMMFVTLLLAGTVAYSASYVKQWVANLTPKAVTNVSCNQSASSQALTPGEVTINVYNATARSGLAASAADGLQKQGFKIATIDNDPLGKTILGIGEIRYGPSGLAGATLAAKRLPGARMVPDGRMDASVDVVVGKTFKAVTVPPTIVFSKTAKTTAHC